MELSVYAFVGIIMLIGIVKKNAIMMIDFAIEAERNEDKSAGATRFSRPRSVRFRPIMMTTMAALMGTLPIAIGVGRGRANRGVRWASRSSAAWRSRSSSRCT